MRLSAKANKRVNMQQKEGTWNPKQMVGMALNTAVQDEGLQIQHTLFHRFYEHNKILGFSEAITEPHR